MFKAFVSILFVLTLFGCANSQSSYDPSSIKLGEGIILLDFACKGQVVEISIYKSGSREPGTPFSSPYKKIPCSKDGGMIIMNLPEGDYFVGSAMAWVMFVTLRKMSYGKSFVEEAKANKFRVEKNVIKYIGSLKPKTDQRIVGNNAYVSINLVFVDEFDKAESFVRDNYPSLSEKYGLVKAIAKN